jgi:hypothetical protein
MKSLSLLKARQGYAAGADCKDVEVRKTRMAVLVSSSRWLALIQPRQCRLHIHAVQEAAAEQVNGIISPNNSVRY